MGLFLLEISVLASYTIKVFLRFPGEFFICVGENIVSVGENIICVGEVFMCVGEKIHLYW